MGMFKISTGEDTKPPNPDPSKYEIKYHEQRGKYLIVIIYYPGCTSFEGNYFC